MRIWLLDLLVGTRLLLLYDSNIFLIFVMNVHIMSFRCILVSIQRVLFCLFLLLTYIDCIYHHWQIKRSHVVYFYLFVFWFEVDSRNIYIYIYIYIYIIIIIIIMSRRQRGYPWPSLAISPYHSSPPAGLQGYILCPHIVAVCKFVLVVLLLHIHMWGSTGVHRLWARPCFSSSVPRIYIYTRCIR